jgi:putative ABC transport system permease protein
MIDTLVRDLRFGLRTLFKSPGFFAAVVVTMALGIGAATSMFTVVNAVVLRPLPFPDSDRAVMLCETSPRVRDFCVASPANVADWAAASRSLDSAGVARTESFIARGDEGATGIRGGIATPGFFRVLRLRPALGRLFEDRDLDRAANGVAVVSQTYWRQALHADPGAVGRAIDLDGRPFVVIGVLPGDAYLPDMGPVEIWKPLTASIDDVTNRGWRGFAALGRLAGGASRESLAAELDTIRARLAAAYPASNDGWGIRVVDLRDRTVGATRATLWIFLGATVCVLLIACANVASLLLVRATRRAPEFAVRASLGAGRARLVRQLLTESAVLSIGGGLLGLLLASWVTRAFVAMAPASIPRLDEVSIDARVAAFAILVSLATALVFGLAPALRASATDGGLTLKAQRHGGGAESRVRASLVVIEMALALVLLVGAGLLARTFGRLLQWDPGFPRAGLVQSWMLVPTATYTSGAAAVEALERAREAVAAVPGIRLAALGSGGPLIPGVEPGTIAVAGRPPLDPSLAPTVNWFDVSPEYFDVFGLPIVSGRGLTAADAVGAPPVAIVNQALARRIFPDASPIGQRVTVGRHTSEIVGVVTDVRSYRPDRPTPPEIYWPIRQYPRLAAYLLMRLDGAPAGLDKSVRARVAAIDPGIQVTALQSLDERFARALVSPRFNMVLLGAFAIAALTLAAVGVFAVMAFSVASRTREIGVRIALGASPRRLVREVVGRSLALAGTGMILGLVGAFALGRFLETLLYGLAPTDPIAIAAALAGFFVVAAVAGYLPARRAARIDPLTALKQE